LGADNGIAIALAMGLVDDPDVVHGPLELLFTVDEETGLTGAKNLDPRLMRGTILLNLDSEDEGVFTVGCAGGRETLLSMHLDTRPAPPVLWSLGVTGLRGGHSGVDIHLQRANAGVLLARLLNDLQRRWPLRLAAFDSGTAHNAIPRDATAVVVLNADSAAVKAIVADWQAAARAEFTPADTGLAFSAEPCHVRPPVLHAADSARIIALLLALPHGPARMSAIFENLVETSHNLAMIRLKNGDLAICASQRSLIASGLEEASAKTEAIAALAGAAARCQNDYPPWTPDMDSPLLARCRRVYHELFGRYPEVKSIHAGLECAIIKAKRPEMEMISLGPTLRNPHSPDERLLLPSIRPVWDFTAALLASYAV
jgi:dipeptidase D